MPPPHTGQPVLIRNNTPARRVANLSVQDATWATGLANLTQPTVLPF